MLTFLSLLGFILLAGFIATFFIPVRKEDLVEKERIPNPDRRRQEDPVFITEDRVTPKSPTALIALVGLKARITFLALGLFLMLTPGLFFWADATEQYFMVYPWGTKGSVMEQGVKLRGFAKITSWPKYIDVKVVLEGEDASEIEGVMKPIAIRFIDQVTANVIISTRYQIPADEPNFEKMAVKFQSLSNLVNNTLIPATKEQVNNTGYMFKAQDYISGEAQSFRQTLEEQLNNGAFVVEKLTMRDTIWTGDKSRTIKEIKTTYQVEKVLKNGIPQRIAHEITANNIGVSQVIVDDVLLEPAFKTRLEKQRDESALRQLEQQKIETAKDSQLRIIAEGERDKAQERVTQEKAQVVTLIAIETKLKEEATNKQLAQIQLETERVNATKRKVEADADAYVISKKVRAGITPEVRLKMELDAQVAIETEKAKTKWPVYYMPGAGKAGGSIEALISAGMAKQLGVSNK